jgi:hypothetical protein
MGGLAFFFCNLKISKQAALTAALEIHRRLLGRLGWSLNLMILLYPGEGKVVSYMTLQCGALNKPFTP